MRVYTKTSLKSFEFWGGAVDRVAYLTDEDLDVIEAILEELYPEGLEDVQINDLLWFEEDFIAECLGFTSFDEVMNRNNEEEDEDEDE